MPFLYLQIPVRLSVHDYGKHFAEKTMGLMPGFINDAKQLEATLRDTKQDD